MLSPGLCIYSFHYALRLTLAWEIHTISDVEIAFGGDDDGGGGGVVGVPIAMTVLTIWPAMMMVVQVVWSVFPSRFQDFMDYASMIRGSSRIAQIQTMVGNGFWEFTNPKHISWNSLRVFQTLKLWLDIG